MLPYIAAPWILWAMSWPIFRQTQSGFCSLDGADVRDVNILEMRRRARCRAKSSRKKKNVVLMALMAASGIHPDGGPQSSPWLFQYYPLVNEHNYGKPQCLMDNSTINGNFQ